MKIFSMNVNYISPYNQIKGEIHPTDKVLLINVRQIYKVNKRWRTLHVIDVPHTIELSIKAFRQMRQDNEIDITTSEAQHIWETLEGLFISNKNIYQSREEFISKNPIAKSRLSAVEKRSIAREKLNLVITTYRECSYDLNMNNEQELIKEHLAGIDKARAEYQAAPRIELFDDTVNEIFIKYTSGEKYESVNYRDQYKKTTRSIPPYQEKYAEMSNEAFLKLADESKARFLNNQTETLKLIEKK